MKFRDSVQNIADTTINMPRESEPSLNERAFVLQALRENIRLDGRAFDAFRDMELSFGDEYGVADVRLGKTRYCSLQPPLQTNGRCNTKRLEPAES